MTKDELKKEAEESFEKYRVTDIDYVVSPYSEDEGEKKLMFNNEYDAEEEYFRLYSKGYLASAEPREKQIREKDKKIAGLEKENNLLEEWRSKRVEEYCKPCIFAIKVDLDKLDKLEKENAELKERNAELKGMYAHSAREAGTYKQFLELKEKENAELKEELKKWKDEWQEQVQKATDEGYARTLQTMQLTKAKELLKDITSSYGSTEVSEAQLYLKIKKAEQFLNEVKNEKHQRKEM